MFDDRFDGRNFRFTSTPVVDSRGRSATRAVKLPEFPSVLRLIYVNQLATAPRTENLVNGLLADCRIAFYP